jgi:hypothetical protein
LEEENNTCLTVSRPKSSSGGGAFVGRIFTAGWGREKLLLEADVRRCYALAARKEKARIAARCALFL